MRFDVVGILRSFWERMCLPRASTSSTCLGEAIGLGKGLHIYSPWPCFARCSEWLDFLEDSLHRTSVQEKLMRKA
jgi:hypothetical protein